MLTLLQSSRSAVLSTGKQNIYKVKDKNDFPANGSSSTSNAGLFTPPSDEKSTVRLRNTYICSQYGDKACTM